MLRAFQCTPRFQRFYSTMARRTMNVTFLGTCSGGGPNESRNCSSLVLDCLGNNTLWMVDCAEGTTRQFAFQPSDTPVWLKPQSISKLFVTHMHADHIMGIIPFLRNILYPPPVDPNSSNFPRSELPKIEIFGPSGIRLFVRSILKMTSTRTADKYVVHELLRADDIPTSCEPTELHSSEVAGRDIRCSEDGFWREFTRGQSQRPLGDIVVDAGPILHRDPCLGYIFSETDSPRRQIVILGDCYDASPMIPLCQKPALVIHEATDACIPREIQPSNKRTPDTVLKTALARGHSIPQMAGEFAKAVGAEKLVLNHIGGRFPAPRHDRDPRLHVIREIERQASEAFGGPAKAAWDFCRITVHPQSQDTARPPVAAYADPNEGLLYINNKKRKW
ncbi:beta-lactamase-like protein [Mycena amicta]|nr:beta-lactamase-like protein [Mycena amicta]